MLKESFIMLQKIETGIKHKSAVKIFLHDDRLVLEAAIVCTKNRRPYVFQRFFDHSEMIKCDENSLIDNFIQQANEKFRMAYNVDIQ